MYVYTLSHTPIKVHMYIYIYRYRYIVYTLYHHYTGFGRNGRARFIFSMVVYMSFAFGRQGNQAFSRLVPILDHVSRPKCPENRRGLNPEGFQGPGALLRDFGAVLGRFLDPLGKSFRAQEPCQSATPSTCLVRATPPFWPTTSLRLGSPGKNLLVSGG